MNVNDMIGAAATPRVDPVQVAVNAAQVGALRWITQRAGGVVVVRHRTAIEALPDGVWPDRLAEFLALDQANGMVGAKRLDGEGKIVSMGEFVIHPKGFHALGKGLPGECYRFAEEVDAVVAGVAVVEEAIFDAVDGDELLAMGELGMLALSMAIREAGKRVVCAPQVVVTDPFMPEPGPNQNKAFKDRFGFDWIAADLVAVRERYRGTGLLWNTKFHAGCMPFEKYEQRGALVWESYQKADFFRKRAHHLASAAKQCCPDGLLLDVGCGDGFFSHLFATQGIEVLGIDPEPEGVEQSRKMTAPQKYPAIAPRFDQGCGDAIPLGDGEASAVTLFDVIEHLDNPVVVLNEIARVLKVGGKALVVTPGWQFGASSDATYHGFEYTMEELVRQLNAIEGLSVCHTGQITGIYRDLVVVAEKTS